MNDWLVTLRHALRRRYVSAADAVDRFCEELPWRAAQPLGARGEQIARRYLKRCGYLILAQNYRAAGAELDLIALDHEELVFVEVKARATTAAGAPEEAVNLEKQQHIRRAASSYVAARHAQALKMRFDVVAITGIGRQRRLELIKDAF